MKKTLIILLTAFTVTTVIGQITTTKIAPKSNKPEKTTADAIIRMRTTEGSNIKVTGNAKPEDVDLPETFVAFSRVATG